MMIFLYIILGLIVIFIISLISTPYIDNAIRFSSLIGQTTDQMRKRYSTFRKESPEDFLYKFDDNNDIYKADYKLTMGGPSELYFEIENDKVKKILIISKFDADKWFKRVKKTYIENRNEKYTIDDSLNYGVEIYQIIPKEYKSFLRKFYNSSRFDFGVNHKKKFFMFFY